MNVLVTGGAGYIGSHLIGVLASAGHDCTVYDNLAKGHAEAVGDTKLIIGDISDASALTAAMRENDIEAVIHLAAFIEAGESVEKPEKYFRNNTLGGLTLLEAMRDAGVSKMVFSSTAAVYGQPEQIPICETDRTEPINPYGSGKLCVEFMLRAFAEAYGMGFVALRYFNVAGARADGLIGEAHSPETHLIPLVLEVPLGKRESVKIFGDDYDTLDGTCIRDYIHVMDLSNAHVLALDAIEAAARPGSRQGGVKVFNLGNGEGFSVREVIETCRAVTGHPISADVADRRPGDPPRLVASSQKAKDELGWKCQYPGLETIVAHAWQWHKTHPNGYAQGGK
ncbi:MAG: UDP-glucose 4-epimerase GalE [Phycisphaerae bacterium]|nr:UDP-glucose 4-epimerase GalE [Phycisphaerae bacterium]